MTNDASRTAMGEKTEIWLRNLLLKGNWKASLTVAQKKCRQLQIQTAASEKVFADENTSAKVSL